MSEHPVVTLGRAQVPCIAQPTVKLYRRLSKHVLELFESADSDLDVAGLLGRVGDGAYQLVCQFYPQLRRGEQHERLPEWEFNGYPTREAWEAGQDDDDAEPVGPTTPQLIDALTLAVRVNRLDEVKRISRVIDPKRVKAYIDARLDVMVAEVRLQAASTASPISLSTSGTSGSTSSTATSPTSPPSAD